MKHKLVVSYRLVFAVVVLVAVAVQFHHGTQQPQFNAVNYFSFFTIESNILGAFVLLASVFVTKQSAAWNVLRGAATFYMVMTGIIYVLLLAGADVQTPIPWINTMLHYIFPVVMLFDWLVDPPRPRISTKRALLWLVFPVLYVVYSLIRGHFVGWYPYPFLDVAKLGAGRVLVNAVVIGGCIVLLTLFIANVHRIPVRKRRTARA